MWKCNWHHKFMSVCAILPATTSSSICCSLKFFFFFASMWRIVLILLQNSATLECVWAQVACLRSSRFFAIPTPFVHKWGHLLALFISASHLGQSRPRLSHYHLHVWLMSVRNAELVYTRSSRIHNLQKCPFFSHMTTEYFSIWCWNSSIEVRKWSLKCLRNCLDVFSWMSHRCFLWRVMAGQPLLWRFITVQFGSLTGVSTP